MTQKEYFGLGSINNLKKILLQKKARTIFLVTGKKSYLVSGAKKILDQLLKNFTVIQFSDFQINPKIQDIKKGLKLFRKNKIDLVIAVGGGSVIDTAKSINILAAHHGEPVAYIKKEKEISRSGQPLVAIPTTSGTGSEATHFAVVYINKTKYSLAHQYVLPTYSIIDPQFTFTLPARITAPTGIDALGQAIEAYWSVNSTPKSKRYAHKAVKLVLKNLNLAVNKPTKNSRTAMSQAANLAGKAINISKTTACHAVSYPFTSYFHLSHGHAVGLTLPSLLKYNADITKGDILDKRGVKYVKNTINNLSLIIGNKNPKIAANKISRLMKNIGLETKLSKLGIDNPRKINLIIKNGFNPDRVKNNPRLLTEKNLRQVLTNLL